MLWQTHANARVSVARAWVSDNSVDVLLPLNYSVPQSGPVRKWPLLLGQ